MPPTKARRAAADSVKNTTPTPEPAALTEVEQLRLDVERLTRELRAHQDREAKEKEAAGMVRAAEHELEGAKAHVAAIKEKLAKANQELAAIVMGGAQTSFLEKNPTFENLDDQPSSEAEKRWLGCKQVEGTKAKVTFDQLDEVCPVALSSMIASEKPLAVDAVNLYGELPFMVAEQYDTAGFRCYACLPLLTKDEWQQLYEAKYGRAVEGFDQSDEAKAQRQLGGDDCGRVVKVGRKKLVVGPKEQALVVCFEIDTDPVDAPPADDDSDSTNEGDE